MNSEYCTCELRYATRRMVFCDNYAGDTLFPLNAPSEGTLVLHTFRLGYNVSVEELQEGTFQRISVTNLFLSGLGLKEISPGAFSGLRTRYGDEGTHLLLDDNQLTRLDANAFDPLLPSGKPSL